MIFSHKTIRNRMIFTPQHTPFDWALANRLLIWRARTPWNEQGRGQYGITSATQEKLWCNDINWYCGGRRNIKLAALLSGRPGVRVTSRTFKRVLKILFYRDFGTLFFSARLWGLLIELPFFGVISKLLIEVIGLRSESRGRLFANKFEGKRSAVLDFSLNLLIRIWGYIAS